MKSIIYILILMSLVISCEKNVVQTPAKQESDNFMKVSRERELERQKEEYSDLENWIGDNPQYHFEMTQYGYWADDSTLQKMDERNLEELDYVQYIKQYKNLDNKVIYSYEDNGIQNMILGKTEEIRGIESVLRNLEEGDKSILLLPSFMAYGLYGDENKIGAHQPIIVELEVLKIKKNL